MYLRIFGPLYYRNYTLLLLYLCTRVLS